MLVQFVIYLIQLLVILALAPLLNGLIKKFKAFFQLRKGPPLFQSYHDLIKLMRKDSVVSDTTSWLFNAVPVVSFASVLAAGLMIPIFTTELPFGFAGDLIAVIYLFALARFSIALAALDTGSSFGGMGASREMFIASIVEPAMMLSIFAVAINVGTTNLGSISMAVLSQGISALSPSHLLAFVAFFIISIAETGRLPVDNPATHLELTMVHEAMILEYSGKQLAVIELGVMMKQLLVFALLANIFFPCGISSGLNAGVIASIIFFTIKIIVLGGCMAIVESTTAKWRLFRLPDLMSISLMLAFLSVVFTIIMRGG